ncbi:NAD(P)-binding protein [bacterium]|nr:NAD(P)-binding protein [bacterium]
MSSIDRDLTAEPPVLIIGGGLAGLACAAGLALHQVPAVILESRPRLGGRASSFQDRATTEWVDNCQHVAMGCCTNFRHFCRITEIEDQFQAAETLYFVGDHGRIHRFAANPGPAPLHLAMAFAGLGYLTWADKLALARGLSALARQTQFDDRQSFAEWLAAHKQPSHVIERFWHVVLVSALSESLDRISVPHARKVLVDGFLRHRDAWKVSIPRTPLEEVFGTQVRRWLETRGVQIHTLTAAESIQLRDEEVAGIQLRDGTTRTAADYVLAVPWHCVPRLLPEEWRKQSPFEELSQLESAPISSVHLWFDRPVMPLPHAVFTQGLVQWVFQRSDPQESGASESSCYYQVVISASREVVATETEVIQQRVLDELANVWPAVRSAKLLAARQVTEHRAVFSVTPGVESLRPRQQSPWPNLQLAGDYTQTGWPATIEGAVRSGFLAAENVLKRRGRDVSLIQPDLPTSWLSRWLYAL